MFFSSLKIFGYSLKIFEILHPTMVIVTDIWQKLSNVEHEMMLIVTHYWQLFSQIFGKTLLIVTNIWRNRPSFREYVSS